MNETYYPIDIKIDNLILDYASKVARPEPTKKQRQLVYEKIVAVGAVATWLHSFEITTDLTKRDTITDLVLPGIGSIECHPLPSEQTAINLPSNTTEGKLACVIVTLQRHPNKTQLLGFVPADEEGYLPEVIKIQDLEDLDLLIELLITD